MAQLKVTGRVAFGNSYAMPSVDLWDVEGLGLRSRREVLHLPAAWLDRAQPGLQGLLHDRTPAGLTQSEWDGAIKAIAMQMSTLVPSWFAGEVWFDWEMFPITVFDSNRASRHPYVSRIIEEYGTMDAAEDWYGQKVSYFLWEVRRAVQAHCPRAKVCWFSRIPTTVRDDFVEDKYVRAYQRMQWWLRSCTDVAAWYLYDSPGHTDGNYETTIHAGNLELRARTACLWTPRETELAPQVSIYRGGRSDRRELMSPMMAYDYLRTITNAMVDDGRLPSLTVWAAPRGQVSASYDLSPENIKADYHRVLGWALTALNAMYANDNTAPKLSPDDLKRFAPEGVDAETWNTGWSETLDAKTSDEG